MSKVITFSRLFPQGHAKAGQPTYFVEKIWESIYLDYAGWSNLHTLVDIAPSIYSHCLFKPKHHTIRAGHRFKVGDKFSPRVWSGKPYQSKQIIIAPDIEVKKVWDFKITTENDDGEHDWSYIDFVGKSFTCYSEEYLDNKIKQVIENDGLTVEDFWDWFEPQMTRTVKQKLNYESQIFDGQIICWNENVNY